MLTTIIRVLILYVFISIGIRIMGKRNIGELQPTELVITILLSEFASIPIEDSSIPLINSLIPVMLLIGLEIINSVICLKSVKYRNLRDGNPVVIIKNGNLDQKAMKSLRITADDILSALRQKDVFDLKEVLYAVMETNGNISVLLKTENQNATKQDVEKKPKNDGFTTPVIIDGVINKNNLAYCNLNTDDVYKVLEKEKIAQRNIFIMNIDSKKNADIFLKDDVK